MLKKVDFEILRWMRRKPLRAARLTDTPYVLGRVRALVGMGLVTYSGAFFVLTREGRDAFISARHEAAA